MRCEPESAVITSAVDMETEVRRRSAAVVGSALYREAVTMPAWPPNENREDWTWGAAVCRRGHTVTSVINLFGNFGFAKGSQFALDCEAEATSERGLAASQ